MTKPKKAVAIYARVSTDKQKVDMQLNELRQFVARSGWKIYKEYIDQSFNRRQHQPPGLFSYDGSSQEKKIWCAGGLEAGPVKPITQRPD